MFSVFSDQIVSSLPFLFHTTGRRGGGGQCPLSSILLSHHRGVGGGGGGALRLVRGGGRGGLSGHPAGVTLGSGSADDEEAGAGASVLGGSWGKGGP